MLSVAGSCRPGAVYMACIDVCMRTWCGVYGIYWCMRASMVRCIWYILVYACGPGAVYMAYIDICMRAAAWGKALHPKPWALDLRPPTLLPCHPDRHSRAGLPESALRGCVAASYMAEELGVPATAIAQLQVGFMGLGLGGACNCHSSAAGRHDPWLIITLCPL